MRTSLDTICNLLQHKSNDYALGEGSTSKLGYAGERELLQNNGFDTDVLSAISFFCISSDSNFIILYGKGNDGFWNAIFWSDINDATVINNLVTVLNNFKALSSWSTGDYQLEIRINESYYTVTTSDEAASMIAILQQYLGNDTTDNIIMPTPTAADNPSKDEVEEAVDAILSCQNSKTDTAKELIKKFSPYMTSEQMQQCLVSYGRWKSVEMAEHELVKFLKSPRSYYRYSGSVGTPIPQEDESFTLTVELEYGATNSFNAEIKDTVKINVNYSIDIEAADVTYNSVELSAFDAWKMYD